MKRKKFSEIVKHGISFAKKNYADASTFLVAITLAIAKFGPRIADKITGKEIENWLNKLQEERGWTNSTWNHWLTYLSMTFREAKRKGDVTVNPAHLARRKRVVESKVRFVTEEEEMRLRAAIVEPRGGFPKDNESCEAQLVTAIYTGMRRKEQFSMVWNQVDLERGLIFLPNTKPDRQSDEMVPDRTQGRRHTGRNVAYASAYFRLATDDEGCQLENGSGTASAPVDRDGGSVLSPRPDLRI
jgi:integrase